MTVILRIQLDLPPVESLKEKRRILKSLMAKIKNKFNVSIAEVGNNDVLRSAILGAAVVSNSTAFGDQVIAQIVNHIENSSGLVIIEYSTEVY